MSKRDCVWYQYRRSEVFEGYTLTVGAGDFYLQRFVQEMTEEKLEDAREEMLLELQKKIQHTSRIINTFEGEFINVAK